MSQIYHILGQTHVRGGGALISKSTLANWLFFLKSGNIHTLEQIYDFRQIAGYVGNFLKFLIINIL